MALAESLFAKLTASGAATAAVTGVGDAARVFPIIAPINTPAPYIVYQRISTTPATTHGEAAQTSHVLVQFSCYAETYAEAQTLRAAVVADLDNEALADGVRGVLQDERDSFEPAVDLHRADADLTF